MLIKKAILPVAGFGTRFLPATKAQPKEMLPVVDKPAIQYLVEEAAEAGIEDVIFITGRGKRAIEDHFDYSFELDHNLVENNKMDLVEKVRSISQLARFTYIRQPMPLGDGHAVACAAHLLNDEPVLVIFGDTLYDAEISPAKQVIAMYQKYQTTIVGLAEVEPKEVVKFGVIAGEEVAPGEYQISQFVEKPKVAEAPSNLAAAGVYVITPEVFRTLATIYQDAAGEIHLSDAFALMLKDGQPIYGKKLAGEWLDTGSKLGWIKATIKLGLKHPEIGQELREFLKNLKI